MASGQDAYIFLKAKSDYVPLNIKLGLAFKKGAIFALIHNHKHLDHRRKLCFVFNAYGRYGFIPENCVKQVKLSKENEEDFLETVRKNHELKTPPTKLLDSDSCLVIDNYIPPPADREVSLSLEVGDVVKIERKTGDGWFYGTCRGISGWFPKHFVRECSVQLENKERLIYHFTVEATNSNLGKGGELPFSAKDRLDVIKRPVSTDSHWVARNEVGKIGLIPKTHVDERPEVQSVLMYLQWYHGACSRKRAENLLRKHEMPHHFLVRDSESFPGCFTINVSTGVDKRILNIAVEVSMSGYKVNDESFESLKDLIVHFRDEPIFDSAPELMEGYQIYLHHPVLRSS